MARLHKRGRLIQPIFRYRGFLFFNPFLGHLLNGSIADADNLTSRFDPRKFFHLRIIKWCFLTSMAVSSHENGLQIIVHTLHLNPRGLVVGKDGSCMEISIPIYIVCPLYDKRTYWNRWQTHILWISGSARSVYEPTLEQRL